VGKGNAKFSKVWNLTEPDSPKPKETQKTAQGFSGKPGPYRGLSELTAVYSGILSVIYIFAVCFNVLEPIYPFESLFVPTFTLLKFPKKISTLTSKFQTVRLENDYLI
jgi:hypothetical protein